MSSISKCFYFQKFYFLEDTEKGDAPHEQGPGVISPNYSTEEMNKVTKDCLQWSLLLLCGKWQGLDCIVLLLNHIQIHDVDGG